MYRGTHKFIHSAVCGPVADQYGAFAVLPRCEDTSPEVCDPHWIAARAEINKAKVNVIVIIGAESYKG